MRKRLLCIAPDDAHAAALMTGPIHDWDTCCVNNLGDADRARAYAKMALRYAAQRQPSLPRFPAIGTVRQASPVVHERLLRLAQEA